MTDLRLSISGGSPLTPYVASTPSGRAVGEIDRNWLPRQPIPLAYDGKRYRIEFRTTSDRLLVNDARFELVGDAGTLASASKRVGEKAFDIAIGDVAYRLLNRNRWLSMRFVLQEDGNGREVGGIEETTGFSLWRRRFELRVPEAVGGPAALLLFFLAANHTYS